MEMNGTSDRSSEFDVSKIDMTKLKKVAEGKTKQILEIPNMPSAVVIRSKDRITAFNAERQHDLEGKASLSNITNCMVFDFLRSVGLRTHFIKKLNDTDFLAEHCAMVPLEWVTRRVATGSFLKRNPGVAEGYRFNPPKLEIFYKDDAKGDPQWSAEMVTESGLVVGGVPIGTAEVELMSRATVAIFEVLEKAWSRLGCTLIDMKVEFGVNVEGGLVLADVIDSDSWRLWPNGDRRLQVDKQFYRDLTEVTPEALTQLKKNFAWVTDKLKEFITPPKGRVAVLMGSPSDRQHCEEIRKACNELGIPADLRVTSAHKGTCETLQAIAEYESDGIPTVFVAVAGRSNGLGPVTSGNTCYPVINCPPLSPGFTEDVWSSLRMPSGLSCSTVLTPDAAALSAASSLSLVDHMIWCRLRMKQLTNHITLMKADKKMKEENAKMMEKLRFAMPTASSVVTNATNGH